MLRLRPTLPLVAALCLMGAEARAQIAPAEFAARRDSLAGRIENGVVIAFGGRTPVTDFGPFYQLPAFHYLTDYDQPDGAFLLIVRNGSASGVVFTMPIDPREAVYYGRRPDSAAVARATGLPARPMAQLAGVVDSLVAAGLPVYSLADFEDADFAEEDSLTRGGRFIGALTTRHPGLTVQDAHPMLDQLRARKSPAELGLIRRAAAISSEGHRAAMRAARAGGHEYQMQAAAEYVFQNMGGARPAYGSIVGSGENGTQLHYMKNRGPLKDGDLVVIDAGTEYQGYASDVTRTIPVSGKFTAEQRALYQLVRDAQAAAERNVGPGRSAAAAFDSSVVVRARGLAALGLIESADATFDPPWQVDCTRFPRGCRQVMLWTVHGISHGIGLAVHDPAQFYYGDRTFQPGDAFTLEPGIYINSTLLDLLPDTPRNRAFKASVKNAVARYDMTGVRIEDDYVVTAEGVEWISHAPREASEVESAMRGGRESAAAPSPAPSAPSAGRR